MKKLEDRRRETEVKERPMLFGTPMVEGIQVGLKTQTRRTSGLELINLTPDIFQFNDSWKTINRLWDSTKEACPNPIKKFWVFEAPGHEDTVGGEEPGKIFVQCPYGQVGDLLWVRETWCSYPYAGNDGASGIIFKADKKKAADWGKVVWKPSIHMKKSIARIWLEIKDIRVERLQDITEKDAIAEGILREADANPNWIAQYRDYLQPGICYCAPIISFETLWQSINGPGSWDANPWVWVVEFKKINK